MLRLVFTGHVIGIREMTLHEEGSMWQMAVLAQGNQNDAPGISLINIVGERAYMPQEKPDDMLNGLYKFVCDDCTIGIDIVDGKVEYQTCFVVASVAAV